MSIQRLTDEILSYIFLFASQSDENRYDSSTIMPLTISHTASRWRRVAQSTGTLWTNVVITNLSCASIQRIHTWLFRSKKYPLRILLDFRDDVWDWEGRHQFTAQHMKILLPLLTPHVERWKSFDLITDTWEPIHTFLSMTRKVSSAPMLEYLMLSRCNAYFARRGQSFQPADLKVHIPLFGGVSLPKLREISFVGVHVNWAQSSLCNLRKLEFKFHAYEVMPSLQEFTKILSLCPNLDTLSILGWGPRLDNYNPEVGFSASDDDSDKLTPSLSELKSTIVLENLVNFSYGFVDVPYGLHLLSLFRLPSLRRFNLEDVSTSVDSHGLGPGDASPILDWLASSDSSNLRASVDATDSIDDLGQPAKLAGIAERTLSSSSSPAIDVINGNRGCTLPLLNVERLGLSGLSSNESTFFQFFRAFSSVKKISLSDMDSNVLSTLSPQNPSPEPVEGNELSVEALPMRERISVEDSCERNRRSSFSLVTSRSRVAPCPQLVDIVCRVADPSKLSALVQLLVRRARLDSGVQRVQSVRIEATPPLVYDDEDELGDYDTSFEDSFSSGGLSEADRQGFEGVILSNGYVGDYVDSGC
ncbi:hypothetical protein VKT23_008449 [Stygiomarasmius scandens]|uniref:F-box domain-containing protein n=1 Tax=Marasmiellus scandens TaxID=2682957 RepID=A0ABR1JGF6_9AGAR